jgi:thiamine-phosphate pyrophosphorylase
LPSKPAPPRPAPRLYLATPVVDDPSALVSVLLGVLAGADIAAVLVRLQVTDQRTMITRIKALAGAIQHTGAALLLDGHVELVARVGSLSTRHDSMSAGELGADYVLFGEPDAKGHRPSMDAVTERLDWWAELFEPPCIGYAASGEEAYVFARAGADFVLVSDAVWADARGAAAALAEFGQALRQAHADARAAATKTGQK